MDPSGDIGAPVKEVAVMTRSAQIEGQEAEKHIQIQSDVEVRSSEEEIIDSFITLARRASEGQSPANDA